MMAAPREGRDGPEDPDVADRSDGDDGDVHATLGEALAGDPFVERIRSASHTKLCVGR